MLRDLGKIVAISKVTYEAQRCFFDLQKSDQKICLSPNYDHLPTATRRLIINEVEGYLTSPTENPLDKPHEAFSRQFANSIKHLF